MASPEENLPQQELNREELEREHRNKLMDMLRGNPYKVLLGPEGKPVRRTPSEDKFSYVEAWFLGPDNKVYQILLSDATMQDGFVGRREYQAQWGIPLPGENTLSVYSYPTKSNPSNGVGISTFGSPKAEDTYDTTVMDLMLDQLTIATPIKRKKAMGIRLPLAN